MSRIFDLQVYVSYKCNLITLHYYYHKIMQILSLILSHTHCMLSRGNWGGGGVLNIYEHVSILFHRALRFDLICFKRAFLKLAKLRAFLMLVGREFHKRVPPYCSDFSNILVLCRLSSMSLLETDLILYLSEEGNSNRSLIYEGVKPWVLLYKNIALLYSSRS